MSRAFPLNSDSEGHAVAHIRINLPADHTKRLMDTLYGYREREDLEVYITDTMTEQDIDKAFESVKASMKHFLLTGEKK